MGFVFVALAITAGVICLWGLVAPRGQWRALASWSFRDPHAGEPGATAYAIRRVASGLGFSMDQIEPGLLVPVIGNTYAGAAMIGLTATLDIAQSGDRILVVSFGSGAGSDAFDISVTDNAPLRASLATKTQEYVKRRTEIDYATYVRFRGKLAMK